MHDLFLKSGAASSARQSHPGPCTGGETRSGGDGGGGGGVDLRDTNFTRLNGAFASLLETLQSADLPATAPTVNAAVETQKALANLKAKWAELKTKDLASINANLRLANQPELAP